MIIKNNGVKERNGRVRLSGDIFKAFMYKIMEAISRGRAIIKIK